jgi:hypothetical protein
MELAFGVLGGRAGHRTETGHVLEISDRLLLVRGERDTTQGIFGRPPIRVPIVKSDAHTYAM